MDENNSAVETVETEDIDYFEGWDDDSTPVDVDEDGEAEETEAAEDKQDQPTEEAEADEAAEETEEKPESEETKPDGKSWKLKHNGEEIDADEEKMVELAQKGLDYDRVRGERDTFKNEHPKYAEYEKFLNELAQSAGTDVAGLMENVRASMLMQKAEKEGKELTQEAAVNQLRAEAAAAKAAEAQQAEAAKKQANLRAFMMAYPNVRAEDVPLKVLQEGFNSGDLVGAYARYENQKLKTELNTIKQNQKNKERSTGSKKSKGSSSNDYWFDGWED